MITQATSAVYQFHSKAIAKHVNVSYKIYIEQNSKECTTETPTTLISETRKVSIALNYCYSLINLNGSLPKISLK